MATLLSLGVWIEGKNGQGKTGYLIIFILLTLLTLGLCIYIIVRNIKQYKGWGIFISFAQIFLIPFPIALVRTVKLLMFTWLIELIGMVFGGIKGVKWLSEAEREKREERTCIDVAGNPQYLNSVVGEDNNRYEFDGDSCRIYKNGRIVNLTKLDDYGRYIGDDGKDYRAE